VHTNQKDFLMSYVQPTWAKFGSVVAIVVDTVYHDNPNEKHFLLLP